MMWPPMVFRLRVVEGGRRRFRLCVPLFLLWPLVLGLALVLAPIVILMAILTWRRGSGKALLLAGPRFFGLACAVRGLQVDVRSPAEHVFISFW